MPPTVAAQWNPPEIEHGHRRKLSRNAAGQYKLIRRRRKSVGARGESVYGRRWFYPQKVSCIGPGVEITQVIPSWILTFDALAESDYGLVPSHVCRHCFRRRKRKRTYSPSQNFVKFRIEKINSSFLKSDETCDNFFLQSRRPHNDEGFCRGQHLR